MARDRSFDHGSRRAIPRMASVFLWNPFTTNSQRYIYLLKRRFATHQIAGSGCQIYLIEQFSPVVTAF